MADTYEAFAAFERDGWEDPQIVAQYEKELATLTAQAIAPMLDAAGVGPGTRVLDVACGPGLLSRAAAARGAHVIGVDFSGAQVATARERNPELQFEIADASALPFQDATFDAVVTSFGMLHFADPAAAAREALRVLAPAGRLVYSVWDLPERAVALGALIDAVRLHGAPASVPPGPGFFDLSDRQRSRQLLEQAGFDGVLLEQVPQLWSVATPERVFDVFLRSTVRMRATLQAQTPDAVANIHASVRAALAPHRRGDHYELPMPALLVKGEKPR
jgi:SAM-dependent methyltransferase